MLGEGNGNPLQYSCLENLMDGGAWWAAVHGVAGSRTWLSDFTFMHWRRKWQPTLVFLPGESQGGRSLLGTVCGVTQSWTRLTWLSSSKVKILQARLQQYVNQEPPDVEAGFRKGRGTRDQMPSIHWIIEKARELQENIYFCFIDYTKAFDCVDPKKLWKILKEVGISDWETCMQVKKQKLESCMWQMTGSRSRKEDDRAVWCHPACLTYKLSISREMPGWMSYKLELR